MASISRRKKHIEGIAQEMASLKRLFMACGGGAMQERTGPTRAQVGVLFLITHMENPTAKEIASKLSMSPSAATQLMNGLEKQKLILRTVSAEDRRRSEIQVTDKGRGMLERMRKARLAKLSKLLSALSDTELAQLHRLHKKIVTHLYV